MQDRHVLRQLLIRDSFEEHAASRITESEYVLMLVAATGKYGLGFQNSSFYVLVSAAVLKVEGKPTFNP